MNTYLLSKTTQISTYYLTNFVQFDLYDQTTILKKKNLKINFGINFDFFSKTHNFFTYSWIQVIFTSLIFWREGLCGKNLQKKLETKSWGV